MASSQPEGELQQPSPVLESPPRDLPPLANVPALPVTPQGAGRQEVPVKHAARSCCCCFPPAQTKADVASMCRTNALETTMGSPRDKQRFEAREANREIWEPVCNLLWTADGDRWSTFTRLLVFLHAVALVNGAFNLYALLQMWEHRLLFGVMIPIVAFSWFILYASLKAARRDGYFVRMCSFLPATDDQIAACRKFARCLVACCTAYIIVWAVMVGVAITGLSDFDIKLKLNQYGGHGGTWVGVTNLCLDITSGVAFMLPLLLFLYLLRTSSSVAIVAAQYVVSEIDRADQDVETDVSEALRCRIGPWVQTLVEEMLMPLSKCWSLAVAVNVLSLVGIAFVSLTTLIDVNTPKQAYYEALGSVIFAPLCACLIVYSPAKVTTVCEDIRYALNELRTAGVGTGEGMVHSDTDANIRVIETWLSQLNRNQGPGFLLFGKVVNKRLVLTFASKVAGYVVVVVQALQQLQPQQGPVAAVDEQLGIGTYTMTITAQGTTIVGPTN